MTVPSKGDGYGHGECRRTEQRLREANRRLQAEGPALERDKLIMALKAEIERQSTSRAELIAEWRERAKHHRAVADAFGDGRSRDILVHKTVTAHNFSAATLEACANDLQGAEVVK